MPPEECPYAGTGQFCTYACSVCTSLRHGCLYCGIKSIQKPTSNDIPPDAGHVPHPQTGTSTNAPASQPSQAGQTPNLPPGSPSEGASNQSSITRCDTTGQGKESARATYPEGATSRNNTHAEDKDSELRLSSQDVTTKEKTSARDTIVEEHTTRGDRGAAEDTDSRGQSAAGNNSEAAESRSQYQTVDTSLSKKESASPEEEDNNLATQAPLPESNCCACDLPDDAQTMVCCENHERWYHLACAGLQTVPPQDTTWFCPDCVRKRSRKLKIPRSKGYNSKSLNSSSSQKPPKMDRGWPAIEKSQVIRLMQEVLDEKECHNTERKWHVISARLMQRFSVNRSPGAVKNWWNRYGRLGSGIDERNKQNPDRLVTGVQDPASRREARKAKRKARDEDGNEEDDDDDSQSDSSPSPSKRRKPSN